MFEQVKAVEYGVVNGDESGRGLNPVGQKVSESSSRHGRYCVGSAWHPCEDVGVRDCGQRSEFGVFKSPTQADRHLVRFRSLRFHYHTLRILLLML